MTDIPEDYTREQLWAKYQTAERAMREFQERNSNQAEQIRALKETLRHCLREAANAVELLEAESNDDFYNPKQTLDKLNELVVYIAGVLHPPKEEVISPKTQPEDKIYLTEMSLMELLEGKVVRDDDILIVPPKTNELGIMRTTPPKKGEA